MCGIAVAVGCDTPESLVAAAIAGLRHRGDISDPLVSPRRGTAMATRRLRIVDPDGGRQPAASFDGALVVAFNGQIYNHVALRRELEAAGVRFRTRSDTEVLANALRLWGADALGRLNGMFAFVAVRVDTGAFIAARDRFGVKPLYVAQSGRGYLFCSEIRPLLAAVPEGDALLVPPGHILTRDALTPFATPMSPSDGAVSLDDAVALDRLLAGAVASRVPPDLPFALLFSGGIDSTLVAHYARRDHRDAPAYFLGDRASPDYPYAAAYADRTALDLRQVPFDLGSDGGMALVRRVVEAVEAFEPESVRTGLCSYLLCKRVHEDGLRVALAGEGADELFAGYLPLEAGYEHSDELGRSLRDQCLQDMHRTCLQRIDRCGMRFQLEVREPFLDSAVADHALGLGGPALVAHGDDGALRGKGPLRRLYDLYPEALPQEIRDRAKAPFNEGAGLDRSQIDSPLRSLAETRISDAEWREGQREFAAFTLQDKEDLLYIRCLSETLDVWRAPHLRYRPRLVVPGELARRFPTFVVHGSQPVGGHH